LQFGKPPNYPHIQQTQKTNDFGLEALACAYGQWTSEAISPNAASGQISRWSFLPTRGITFR